MRVVVHDLVVEIAPDQLGEPDLGATVAALGALPGLARQAPDRDGAKAQVQAQVAGALDGGEVARGLVLVHAVEKLIEQGLSA